eukprot:m.305620 g.305620  ORF g.305620 m.305620 type:complete len:56 (-) comp16450_c0_seq4:1688-1855(-)
MSNQYVSYASLNSSVVCVCVCLILKDISYCSTNIMISRVVSGLSVDTLAIWNNSC